MTDGGRHFDNSDVNEFCEKCVVAAYSAWINDLVEGTDKILLYILARRCAPDIGEDGWRTMIWKNSPRS